jgi:hypothetical protein
MDSEKNEIKNRVPFIRTMRTDAELYTKEKKLTPRDIAVSTYATQRLSSTSPVSDDNARNNLIFLVGGVVCALLVLSGGMWYFLSFKNTDPIIREAPPPTSMVTTEGQNPLTITRADTMALVTALSEEYVKTFRSGILTYYPIKIALANRAPAYMGIKDFSQLLGWHMPNTLAGIVSPEFNLFIFAGPSSNDFAIIMQATNFERAFSSMLEWERALARDWQTMHSSNNTVVAFPSTFRDETIKNHDARILKHDNGTIIIGYTIFNKKYIIISSSRDALGIILERLIALPPR